MMKKMKQHERCRWKMVKMKMLGREEDEVERRREKKDGERGKRQADRAKLHTAWSETVSIRG